MRFVRMVASASAVLLLLIACSDRKDAGAPAVSEARTHAEADAAIARAVERWNRLSNDVPRLIELIGNRIEQRTRERSNGTQQQTLTDARAALADLQSGWLQAGSAFASGQALDAVRKADEIERRARETLRLL